MASVNVYNYLKTLSMKKLFLRLIFSYLLVGTLSFGLAQSATSKRAVLKGEVVGDCQELVVLVYAPDRLAHHFSPKLENGNFLYEYQDVPDFVDLGVGLDGEVYGVRLYAGDSLHVRFTAQGDGSFEVDYFGKNEREGRIFTDFYNTYGYWGQYNLRPDRDTNMSIAQSLALLAKNDAAFRTKYAQKLDNYYVHRADLTCDFLKLVLLADSAYRTNQSTKHFPEYAEIVSSIDPNDPLSTACALIPRWLNNQLPKYGSGIFEQCFGFLEQQFEQVTFENARRSIAESICNTISMNMGVTPEGKYTKVLGKLEKLLPDYPELVAKCRKSFEEYKSARDMVNLPEATLEKPDGTKLKLSDHYGKVLYIDFWATWCGPCVKETPFMEKLAERYKDNDRVVFISISTDDNVEAWRKKVQNDNPFWPQYRIYGKVGDEFMSAVNLKTIPRFMIVLPNGKVFNIDAPRPSEVEAVTAEIDKALCVK